MAGLSPPPMRSSPTTRAPTASAPKNDAIPIVFWVSVFYATSVFSGVLNKQASSPPQNVHPSALSASHLLLAIAADLIIVWVAQYINPPSDVDPNQVSAAERRAASACVLSAPQTWPQFVAHVATTLWPVALTMVLGKLTTYLAYESLSMPLVQTAKATEPLFNVFLAWLLFSEKQPTAIIISLVPIAIGVGLTSTHDSSYNLFGFIFALASAMFKVLQNITLKRALDSEHFTFFQTHLYIAIASLVILGPVIAADEALSSTSLLSMSNLKIIAFSSVMQYSSSVSSYMSLALTHHLSFTVINCVKRLVVIVAGFWYFGIRATASNVAGIALAVLGVASYKFARARANKIAATLKREHDRLERIAKHGFNADVDFNPSVDIQLPSLSTKSRRGHRALSAQVGALLSDLTPSHRKPHGTADVLSEPDSPTSLNSDEFGASMLSDEDLALLTGNESHV